MENRLLTSAAAAAAEEEPIGPLDERRRVSDG